MTKEDKKISWYRQWQQGQMSGNPGIATGMLLIFLLVTVLAAQMLVWKRAGRYGGGYQRNQDFQQQVKEDHARGSEFIQRVCREGLSSDSYLGRKGQVNYYLIRESGKPAGFSGYSIQPRLTDTGVEFAGREMRFDLSGKHQIQTEYAFTEDLSSYRYTQHIREVGVKYTLHQVYADGILRVFQPQRTSQAIRVDTVLENRSLIPLFLLDFFSSAAAQEGNSEELAFTVAGQDPRNPSGVEWWDCLVRAGGKIPPEMRELAPDGLAVETLWPERLIYGEPHIQTIYYNRQHQLVWQEDPQFGETIEIVTRDELSQQNSRALQLLDSWLKVETYETDSTWL